MNRYKKKQSETPLNNADIIKLLGLLEDGMYVFKKCQELKRPEDIQYSNYAGYCGELQVIFNFLQILEQRVTPFSSSSGMERLRTYFFTDENIPELDDIWKQKREQLKNMPKRVEISLGHIGDLATFSKGITRDKQSPIEELRVKSFEQTRFYEARQKFFSVSEELAPPTSVRDNPETMNDWRRAQVKAMKADSFQAIFKFAQNGDKEHLMRARDLLNENNPKSVFDLKLLVCISFALASFGGEDVDYDTVIRQVRKLYDMDCSLYGAFFALLLSWPRGEHASGGSGIGVSTQKAIINLRGKMERIDVQDPGEARISVWT